MTPVGKIGRWAALVLLLAATTVSTWLLTTTSGLRVARALASPFLPATLAIGGLEGSIVGPIRLENVEIEIESLRASISSADIEWHPLRLLAGEIAIETLRLTGVEIVRSPTGAASGGPFELPAALAPPLGITIETATMTNVSARLATDESSLVLDRAMFGLHWDASELLVQELVLESPQLVARGEIRLVPGGDYAGVAALEWSYSPLEYPPLHGVTTISGSTDGLDVVQRIDAPYGVDARLSVASPLAGATLEGTVALETATALVLPDQPLEAISGTLSVAGPVDVISVSGELDLQAPTAADATINLRSRWEGGRLAIESLIIADPASAARLELAGNIGPVAPLTIDLEGQWTSLQWPLRGSALASSPTGSIQLSGSPQELRADLSAEIAGGSVRGTVERNDDTLSARLDWQDLAYPQQAPTLVSRSGTLNVEGHVDSYRLNADIDLLAVRETVAGHVRVTGHGTRDTLEVEQLDVATLNGGVRGRASIRWRPELDVAATLAFDALDPSVFLDQWPGRIDGRVDLSLTREAGALTAEAQELELSGTLRERPFTLGARGRWRESASTTLDRLDLRIGATSLQARGTVGPTNDLTWTLASPSLADLWPNLTGRLTSEGQLSGAFPLPNLDAKAEGADLSLGQLRIGSLTLTGKVDAAGATGSTVDLVLQDSAVAGHSLPEVELHAAGTVSQHTVTVSGNVDGAQVGVALTGTVERLGEPDSAWSFRLEEANAEYPMFAPWALRAATTGRLTATSIVLDEACWQSLGALLCLQGRYADDAMDARYRLIDLPLRYFAYYLPIGTTVEGTASAEGSFSQTRSTPPLLSIELETSSVWAGLDNADEREGGLAFSPGRASAQLGTQGLRVDLSMPLEGGIGGISLQASATRGPSDTLGGSALTGIAHAEFGDLGFLSEVIRGIDDATGRISADFELRGTLDRPQFSGRAALTNGAARLLDTGILLESTEATLTADGSRGLDFEARAVSGDGDLRATGSLRFDGGTPVGRLAISGADFAFLDLPTIRAVASPDLALDLTQDRATLTGRVVVPRASIVLRDTGADTLRVSPDQILVDADGPQRTTLTRPFYADIQLGLGDSVTFDGLGLKGRFEGALEINETPNEPATGSGELRVVDGTYEAYRQELEIRTGRLIFAGGALSRPGLDIEAVRRPNEDILVGARIRGTLEQPELTLFSEPSMPRQEQLSYLVLGRPLERNSTSETSALSQAALLLGLSGSDMLSERINRSLGFDEFGIQTETGEEQTASFVIGRYLAPSLYVSYGIGLFQQANTLKLRYRITDRWRLETESSSESAGGDVIYHIERGN